jgi:ABC-type multidrug transport system permease subunit
MAREDRQNKSLMAKATWPLLVLTAALQAYLGLSAVAYLFMGVLKPASGFGGWTAASMGGLQAVAAIVAFVRATRHDLRGTTLAVAGSILLGWFSTLPWAVEQGLFQGDDKVTPVYFAVSALMALVAATLVWRNAYPVAAALIVCSMTIFGILVVIAFSIVIALSGF